MRFIELFAGIGGFRYGLERAGHECVYASEWLEKPRNIYNYNYGEMPDERDVRTICGSELPECELVVGGFPCATFSLAGKRTGFGIEDARGTLCFEMFRLASEANIPYLLFENVKGMLNHDDGRTFAVVISALDELGYDCQWELLDTQNFGVPQHRERIFLVGSLRGKPRPKVFPIGRTDGENVESGQKTQREGKGVRFQSDNGITTGTLLHRQYLGNTNNQYIDHTKIAQWRRGYFRDYRSDGVPTLTANMGTGGHNVPFVKACLTPDRSDKRQNGRRFKEHNEPAFTLGVQDRHRVCLESVDQTKIRKLTPVECERLQGLPDNFTKFGKDENGNVYENSMSERYERCGRTVTSTVVEAIGRKLGYEWY